MEDCVKKLFLSIAIIVCVCLILNLCNFYLSDKVEFNTYTFINSSRYNTFNFKYPQNWQVKMMPYWEASEERECNPWQGVTILMDPKRTDTVNTIQIIESISSLNYRAIIANEKYESSELKKNGEVIATIYTIYNNTLTPKTIDIYISFMSAFNTFQGAQITVEEDFYKQNKDLIWQTIKSISINK